MKKTRLIVSLVLCSLLALYFVDFANLVPRRVHLLTKLQFIPALIAMNVVALIIIVALTFLFGRIYCSSICPLGILQDVVAWFSKKIQRKKKYRPLKEQRFLRWSIVALTFIAFWFGASVVVSLLDPYSNFGRIASAIFRPAYLSLNNLVALVDNHFKHYRFYKTDIFISSGLNLAIAICIVIALGYFAYKHGRLFCNTVCPVGTVLGFLARFSIFRITIDPQHCNNCGLCAMKCKGACIDARTKTIDYSRCVVCFNCLETCHRKAMSFRPVSLTQKPTSTVTSETSYKISKRKFIAVLSGLGLAAANKLFGRNPDSTLQVKEIFTSHNIAFKRSHPITPPGAGNTKRFNQHCTACHLCVSKCPSNVLKPALLEYGLAGLFQPMLDFQHGYCNYHCTECTRICPTDALQKITGAQKRTLQPGLVHYIKENCVVVTDGTDCGACSEHCPTQAVNMQPYKGKLRIPVIDESLCVGCGACEYICPVRPYRAIYVDGNPVHKHAKIPEKKVQKKIEVKDFGF